MLRTVTNYAGSLRARWRFFRGRCPECNRNLYAVFAYYMATHPQCFCRGATKTDNRLWQKYQQSLSVLPSAVAASTVVKRVATRVQTHADSSAQQLRVEERVQMRVAARQDACTEDRWEGEGGRVYGLDEESSVERFERHERGRDDETVQSQYRGS